MNFNDFMKSRSKGADDQVTATKEMYEAGVAAFQRHNRTPLDLFEAVLTIAAACAVEYAITRDGDPERSCETMLPMKSGHRICLGCVMSAAKSAHQMFNEKLAAMISGELGDFDAIMRQIKDIHGPDVMEAMQNKPKVSH